MTSISRHGDLSQHDDLSESNHFSHHGGFDPEQAAMLQDLARNGAPEAQIYSHPEAGSNGSHLNGYFDNASNDMHSNELAQSQQDLDLDDPAALLESLANFEHPPSTSNVSISNDHFASLLEAAANAGGEEAARVDLGRTRRSTRRSRAAEEPYATPNKAREGRSRRRLNDVLSPSESRDFVTRGNKRKRISEEMEETEEEEQLRREREREIWGPEDLRGDDPFDEEPEYGHSPIATSEARAAGVHSAAALFRRPTSASKKYTRPPMSKLFTSLELTPEQFLHLQAAAKTYMLDPNFPERRDCVGNRGRTDTDMVKLKLFGCVESFLEDDEWGERCFGSNAEGAETRKLRWPQMKNKLISLVTPLLRRMVTNERQREYAVESRKSSRIASSSGKLIDKRPRDTPNTPSTTREPPPRHPDIDPKLDQYHYSLDSPFAPTTVAENPAAPYSERPSLRSDISAPHNPPFSISTPPFHPSETQLKYHVNILHNSVRLQPKLILSPSSCPSFTSLVQHVRGALNDSNASVKNVQILGQEGLRDAGDDGLWSDSVKSVADCEWMDGDVRVLVEVKYAD